jgi:chondroitin AC lyase
MNPTSKTSILLLISLFFSLAIHANDKDFEIIKSRVVDELMKTEINDEKVAGILENMKVDGSFDGINYDDLSRTAGFPHRRHTGDLVYLAKAFKDEGSGYYHKEELKEKIITSLQYWVEHDFVGDNWHNNQITTPTNLVNLMHLFGEELPLDLIKGAQPMIGRAHMDASGARPSGDRIVIAGILAKNLLFIGDKSGFDEVIKIIEGEIKFNTGSRGMQHDYSFHHRVDRVNNTTSYGYGKYANAFGEWSYYVADTEYAFSKDKINHLVDYYLDGIYKQLVYGIYEDVGVKNRSISNQSSFQPKGTEEIERLLRSTDYRKEELEEILQLRKGERSPTGSFAKFFWQTEHFVFQRPGFYTSVRMFSTRNRNMEMPYNGPGITTHHRADGTNYLMLKGDEYQDIWPVYDWQKISGTTILQKPHLHGPEDIQLDGLTNFVGAVTDGLYGAVAFDFISPHDGIEAKKSWFFFDDAYFCLGAGINAEQDFPVATTINQVLMNGDVTVLQHGENPVILPRGAHVLNDVRWVHQDKIGYVFPTPARVHVTNQTERGRWSDITDQKNVSEEIVNKDVFKLWFDHGKHPNGAAYQYIVVPDISKEELEASSKNYHNIEIIENTPSIQGVFHHQLGMCQIIFYQAGELAINDGLTISMKTPGMVMAKIMGNKFTSLTVSDPSRKSKSLEIGISGTYEVKGDHFTLQAHTDRNSSVVQVNLPEGVFAGKSVVVQLN